MNIQQRRDHSNPSKLLGPSGSWVKEWRAVREKEEKESGTIPRDGDFPEAMDQWILIINEKLETERTTRMAKSSNHHAAEYRESKRRRIAESVLNRRKKRPEDDEDGEEGEDDDDDGEDDDDDDDDDDDERVPWSPSPNPKIPTARPGSGSRSVSRSHSTISSNRIRKMPSQSTLLAKALNRFTDVFEDGLKALIEPSTVPTSAISEIQERLHQMERKQDQINETLTRLIETLIPTQQN